MPAPLFLSGLAVIWVSALIVRIGADDTTRRVKAKGAQHLVQHAWRLQPLVRVEDEAVSDGVEHGAPAREVFIFGVEALAGCNEAVYCHVGALVPYRSKKVRTE